MSWNWCSSTSFHSRSSSSYGYAKPVRSAATVDHSSASRSRCSLRRLPALVFVCVVNVARWFSRYSSPTHTGASGYSWWARVKNSVGDSTTTRGEPSRLASRRARSSISRVGPPPPSPYPNGSSEPVAAPFSAKLRAACASSAPSSSELYVSTGGKCVNTRVPSIPSHQNVWCGMRFVSFHDSFWVRNQRTPASFASCGNAAV